MRSAAFLVAILVLCLLRVADAGQADAWSAAEQAIVRAPESAFPNLPERVRQVLRELKCLVPQPGDRVAAREGPVNVVSGQFARAGQVDWAILCSSGGRSSIHIVWGGPGGCPTPFASAADRHYLQGRGGSRIDFSREIGVVGPEQAAATYRSYGENPPQLSHDTIDDAFVGKGSVRHYCDSGTWRQLIGAD